MSVCSNLFECPQVWANDIQNIKYVELCSWMLLLWDHIVSFDQEVEYIWRGHKNLIDFFYLFLRYGSLFVFGFIHFSGRMRGAYTADDVPLVVPETDIDCAVFLHMTVWPQLVINIIAEYVLAVRVVVAWKNSKWVFNIVAISFICAVSSALVLFALDSPKYSQAKHIYLSRLFDLCVVEGPFRAKMWMIWVIILAYNTVLGYLVLIKVVATYKEEMRRGSLRYIIVQGSLQYYAIIIALSTGVLISGGFADTETVTLVTGNDLVLMIIIVVACRVILDIRRAVYQPGERSLPLGSSFLPMQNKVILVAP